MSKDKEDLIQLLKKDFNDNRSFQSSSITRYELCLKSFDAAKNIVDTINPFIKKELIDGVDIYIRDNGETFKLTFSVDFGWEEI